MFAHLNGVTAKKGDVIQKGAYMGVIGTAGHVHVQLRADPDTAIPIDPTDALNEAAGVNPGSDPTIKGKSAGQQTSLTAAGSSGAAGTAWGTSFRDAAAREMRPLTLDILPNMRDLDPLRAMALDVGAVGGANRPSPTIHVHVHTGDVTMDGRVVGEIVTPYVDQIMADGVQGAADVQNAVYTPGTYQSAFRRPE